MRKFASAFVFLVLGLCLAKVEANEAIGEEDLMFMSFPSVVTASKKQEKIQDAPAVVTVITADEIKDFGANTMYDVIQRLPSVQLVGTHLYPRNAAVIRGDLIGPYDNHILILINGRPFRDDVAGGLNAAFYNNFPLEVIDHIEFIHGPGSVLYGSDAFDGVINVITKKPVKKFEGEVSAGAGAFGGSIGKTTMGFVKNDLSLLVNGNYFKDEGWDYKAVTFFPATATKVSGQTKYLNDNISGSVFLNYKGLTASGFVADIKQADLGVNPAWQLAGTDGSSWLSTTRRFADIGYSMDVADGHKLQANVTYNYYLFKAYSFKNLSSSEGASDNLFELSLSGAIMDKVNYILGGTAMTLMYDPNEKSKIASFSQSYYSGYTQLDYKPIDKLKIVAGAQYNKPADIDAVTVPRLGFIYQFTDRLGTKLSYAEAFRSPWPVETKTNFPGVLVGNSSLTPEKVKTTDVQLLHNTKKTQSTLTVFNSSYEDLVTRVAHPTIANTSSYANKGTMNIQGAEIESKVYFTPDLYVEGSGTYQGEKDNKVLTPNYMVKAGVSYHMPFGLKAAVFDNYYGEPRKNAGLVANPAATAIHLVSVNLNYTIPTLKALSLNLFVQNALNQDYYYPEFSKNWVNTLPLEPGTAWYGTATYKF